MSTIYVFSFYCLSCFSITVLSSSRYLPRKEIFYTGHHHIEGEIDIKMKTNGLLVLLASLPFTLSAPRISGSDNEVHAVADWTTTTTISATLSYTYTTTYKVTEPTITATTTTSSSISKPTYTATELYAVRPGAPFHMMPFQAAGNVFRLGTGNAAYCPTFAQKTGACEQQSNITGVNDCSLVSL